MCSEFENIFFMAEVLGMAYPLRFHFILRLVLRFKLNYDMDLKKQRNENTVFWNYQEKLQKQKAAVL